MGQAAGVLQGRKRGSGHPGGGVEGSPPGCRAAYCLPGGEGGVSEETAGVSHHRAPAREELETGAEPAVTATKRQKEALSQEKGVPLLQFEEQGEAGEGSGCLCRVLMFLLVPAWISSKCLDIHQHSGDMKSLKKTLISK